MKLIKDYILMFDHLKIFDGAVNINDESFKSKNLQKVTIPSSVKKIGDGAFENNELTEVQIPNGVVEIGNFAFFLNKLKTVILSPSVTKIGISAFDDNKLTEIEIPDSVVELGQSAFENNYLKFVKIPSSIKRVGASAFEKNKLKSIEISEGVVELGQGVFKNNRLRYVTLPSSIKKIGESAFEDNSLIEIKIPYGVVEISDNAFENNSLLDVQIPNSVIEIGLCAFYNNSLKFIEIPSSVKKIGIHAFECNNLEDLKISDGVVEICNYAFYKNKLNKITIPSSVKKIGTGAFGENLLTEIQIPYGVVEISDNTFRNNNLIDIKIPNSVKKIGNCAFYKNALNFVEIPNSVIQIGEGAFQNNQLVEIEISNGITEIGNSAFAFNNLTAVKIPYGVTKIGEGAFRNNQLEEVEIPNSVTEIGTNAFVENNLKRIKMPSSVTKIKEGTFDDIDIIYDGVLISKKHIEKYGYKNILKLYQMSKTMPLDNVYDNFSYRLLDTIPWTNDELKGCILNKKMFDDIIKDYELPEEEYIDIFKMCFTLGLFNKPTDEVKDFIKKILKEKNMDYIHQMWTAVKIAEFKPKFKDLFINLYVDGKTEYNGQNIIGRVYSSFETIFKYTLKRHEEIISKKNTEIKRLKELGANTIYLEQELEVLKKNKKNISYDDICYYLKNNVFDIREGNEELKDVANTLSVHMEQDGFDKIQDIYEKSIGVEKTIPLTKDTSYNEFRYHWSKSDNPINTILGYVVGCCAKLGGAGEDIMIQSMINPDIANLILYDENNNIIGKATAYYNRSKKYILFNTAETKSITSKGLKSEKQRQKECLEALIRGAMDAVCALKERGEDISEVRIGMVRNDLENAIREYGLEISYDLLDAYNWNDYAGDASDVSAGQAIIYIDKDKIPKEKNI